jgi:hypothetical protein
MKECGMCGGSGRHTFEPCYECKGHGFVDEPDEDEEPTDVSGWECRVCGEWWEDCVPDCMRCNPPLGLSV